jgi:hypothetical protein
MFVYLFCEVDKKVDFDLGWLLFRCWMAYFERFSGVTRSSNAISILFVHIHLFHLLEFRQEHMGAGAVHLEYFDVYLQFQQNKYFLVWWVVTRVHLVQLDLYSLHSSVRFFHLILL